MRYYSAIKKKQNFKFSVKLAVLEKKIISLDKKLSPLNKEAPICSRWEPLQKVTTGQNSENNYCGGPIYTVYIDITIPATKS